MHSSNLTQAIVSAYLDKGLIEGHLERLRGMYRSRLSAMLEAVDMFFPPQIQYTKPTGGLFLWCVCPDGVDTLELLTEAVEKKVAFIPGNQFFAEDGVKNTFRLNFSNPPQDDIYKGIEILGGLLKQRFRK
jgi:2-aminoadipate transaminase